MPVGSSASRAAKAQAGPLKQTTQRGTVPVHLTYAAVELGGVVGGPVPTGQVAWYWQHMQSMCVWPPVHIVGDPLGTGEVAGRVCWHGWLGTHGSQLPELDRIPQPAQETAWGRQICW